MLGRGCGERVGLGWWWGGLVGRGCGERVGEGRCGGLVVTVLVRGSGEVGWWGGLVERGYGDRVGEGW
jgi:hypothetical protein